MRVVSLRGRAPGTEEIVIDVVLHSYHQLGWKGWMTDDRMKPVCGCGCCGTPEHPLLYLSNDWVEFAYIDRSDHGQV